MGENALHTKGWMLVRRFTAITDGTVVSDTTDETVTQTVTLPADALLAGDRIEIKGMSKATGTNGNDTHTAALRIGGLAGTEVAGTNDVDVANNDVAQLEATLFIKSVGATGVMHHVGRGKWSTAGDAWNDEVGADVAIDTTPGLEIVQTLDQGAANAGNTALGKALDVLVYRSTS